MPPATDPPADATTILWVGSPPGSRSPAVGVLRAVGWHVLEASDGEAATRALHTAQVAAVVVEIGGSIGASVVRAAAIADPDIPIVALALEADDALLRDGAFQVVLAAQVETALVGVVQAALGSKRTPPVDVPPDIADTGTLVGQSDLVRHVTDLVARTAPLLVTVLVRGETGTGKDLIARALHDGNPHRPGPFVKVHCSSLPEALVESELFGYEKGAFTGASARKPGRVELASGGTLFLDEIGDIPASTQVKLLRLLQDKEYERLGGVQTLRADVRFVAATHRDLEGMVKKGTFREDLFYRLNVVSLWMPPLRARREDIPLLADAFCRRFRETYGKPSVELDASAMGALRSQRWPGNVRQLQHLVERLVVLGDRILTAADVERELAEQVQFKTQLTSADAAEPRHSGAAGSGGKPSSLAAVVCEAERGALARALSHSNGNRSVAARILGVSRGTLYSKMREHGLD